MGTKVKAFRKRTEGESKEGEWLVIRLEVLSFSGCQWHALVKKGGG